MLVFFLLFPGMLCMPKDQGLRRILLCGLLSRYSVGLTDLFCCPDVQAKDTFNLLVPQKARGPNSALGARPPPPRRNESEVCVLYGLLFAGVDRWIDAIDQEDVC